ncbi:hypothetical protein PILCRDRAFT_824849 [Piloderma croceum F 1598]|uniref:DUF6533 domain-containing protein n=1 Tax=Piloderma croceum (strain F 1598) TaxID=765440 RepID=A0A0C3AVV5_PILCF|nr:hypothetical protein PILCRDRAFT_824849 [Piloderma croceum F 1598]
MDTESAAVIVQHLQITRYVDAAGLVFLLYDHILTFDDEVRLVWSADTKLPKLLFLINRYFVPIGMILRVNDSSGLTLLKLSDNVCKAELIAILFIGMISIAVSNFLVLLRIWVLWDRNRQLIYCTGAAFLAAQISAFTVYSIVVSRMAPFMIYDLDLFACVLTEKPGNASIASLWIPGLAFEVLVSAVVWWNTLERPRLESNAALTKVLFREGMIYFLVLTSLRVLNLVLGFVAPISLIFMGMLLIWCATTATTSHFILSLRKLSVDGLKGNAINIELQSMDFPEVGDITTLVATDLKM